MIKLGVIDLPAALTRLEQRGDIQKLLNLETIRQDPGLARTPEYQKAFNHYYRLQRKRLLFYESFYNILGEAAVETKAPTFKAILIRLYKATGERHLSFSSKLVATLDPGAAIYDRNVASLFGISTKPLNPTLWIDEALDRYAELTARMGNVVAGPGWPAFEIAFDQHFPGAAHLSAIRKADLILWSAYNDEPNHE